jgi:hypothetical protein
MPLLKVYQDNKSTIILAGKERSNSQHTRHIDVKYFFIKDHIGKTISISYLPSMDMLADILTKPLQGELFKRLRAKLLNMRATNR